MTFPFETLSTVSREAGLVVGVAIGFLFGFVLERAGFGRAPKLAAQFYGDDMTVFKVMFSGIVTAMLGVVVLDGAGLLELRAVSDAATSVTFLWPMIAGGFLLGAGFIISGYCPGTSAVAMASGKLDGLVTLLGVVIGSIVYAELQPALGGFHTAGDLGHLYLYDLLGVPPAVVAAGVVAMAVACFIGAEKLERALNRTAPEQDVPLRLPRRLVWAGFGATAAVALVTVVARPAAPSPIARNGEPVAPLVLAQRVLEEPWTVRILDLRPAEACAAKRIPGAECVPEDKLGELGLADAPPTQELVLVDGATLSALPEPVARYRGTVRVLDGGFAAWEHQLLRPPEPPSAASSPEERAAHRLRSGLHAALTGVKQAPPPAAPSVGAAPKRKKSEGGGCGG